MDREAGSGPPLTRVDVLGIEVSAINLSGAVARIGSWIESDDRQYVCVTGVHGVIESQRDPSLKEIHNRAGMVTPDGMPLVWCGRWAGIPEIDRVYGPDLMLAVMEASMDQGWRHYFYGAGPGVAAELAERLSQKFPGLKVAGTHTPPFRELDDNERASVAASINASGADIVWIGLSTPKQERWMARMRPMLDAPVLIGVGAAFDMHAGNLKQAPRWIQRAGLEWLYRLAREPRRLWKRYAVIVPRFLISILRNRPVRL